MLMPFEWVVGDSSKDHTVTASMFYDVLATVRYTTLWGITGAATDRDQCWVLTWSMIWTKSEVLRGCGHATMLPPEMSFATRSHLFR